MTKFVVTVERRTKGTVYVEARDDIEAEDKYITNPEAYNDTYEPTGYEELRVVEVEEAFDPDKED